MKQLVYKIKMGNGLATKTVAWSDETEEIAKVEAVGAYEIREVPDEPEAVDITERIAHLEKDLASYREAYAAGVLDA